MGEPSSDLVRVVRQSTLPTLLLSIPDERIFAASDEAAKLFGLAVKDLVGRNVEEFSADDPTGELQLVQDGRLSGFQAQRWLRRGEGHSESLQVWVRGVDVAPPVDFAVVVLWPEGRSAWGYLSVDADVAPAIIVGTVDEKLRIERISEDVRVLGHDSSELVCESFLRLIDPSSVVDVLAALADATSTNRGVCLVVKLDLSNEPRLAEMMIRPLQPSPSFTFSLTCGETTGGSRPIDETHLKKMAVNLHALTTAEVLAALTRAKLPGVERLTTRELDIVGRLLVGDRVPAIAQQLFLSQSTVRNHLSTAFRKLGVNSQQELIELFRESAARLDDRDTSSTD